MSGVVFRRTYSLHRAYEAVRDRAIAVLGKYLDYPDLITFSDSDRSVTFSTERIIPATSGGRPRVLLLFSNPHPHSVHQGMFLSPNTKGRENPFWPVMEDAGWLPIPAEYRTPAQLADLCIRAGYDGPFELLFYCYYAFPTDFPEDIPRVFGREYFDRVIAPEACEELGQTMREAAVEAVVTFNKGIFNLVSADRVERYEDRLVQGELIRSEMRGAHGLTPIFLTFPTGWRYHPEYKRLRRASLETIRTAILDGPKGSESNNSKRA
jgi:hypothetical protein